MVIKTSHNFTKVSHEQQDIDAYLLVQKIQRYSYLKWETPKLVKAWTEVDNSISVSAHEVHHL